MKTLLVVVAFFLVIFVIVKIQSLLTVGAGKVLFSGTNKRGKEQVQKSTKMTSKADSAVVIKRFTQLVNDATWPGFPAPKAKVTRIAANQVQVSLRGIVFGLVVDMTPGGSDIEATVLRWKTVNGVIQGGKEMDRLHALVAAAAEGS